MVEPVPVHAQAVKIELPALEPLKEECRAFLNALESRRPPLTDGKNGLEVLAVLEAAQASLSAQGEAHEIAQNFAMR